MPGGVKVRPDPPVAGQDVTVYVENGADKVYWRVAPDGELHEAPAKDGKATIPVPPGSGGKSLSVKAGSLPDRVSDRFPIVELLR